MIIGVWLQTGSIYSSQSSHCFIPDTLLTIETKPWVKEKSFIVWQPKEEEKEEI